jgi:septum formation protein
VTDLVLASTSAIRRTLLDNAGVPFVAVASGVDEERVKREAFADGAGPGLIAVKLADKKAEVASWRDESLVIGADQTLGLDGTLYDKVETVEAARERLRLLRGRTHYLYAALAVARQGDILWRDFAISKLTMRNFSDDFLERYLEAHGEDSLSSVGCYHLEGAGAQLFESIEGDYFAILGLPLIGLLGFLRDRAVIPS